ncbi:uncharacterized protein BDCG_17126 [Blastomyces dermatitidis ER-3]|uniref:Uncharacterized protein n=1 Tax=Ajellomyces dermatitidis (strain ER-3 / ATCC MYA-2586) TaxID=559297 RepID=A0ABX2VWK9_AJEDR|nr:uncharacterized protein BDCG_17126 [Blastomyces dermatitidis ER-3]OAT01535.1 hypothetical protein BDCG_17126 [Blastomyces dermatitidis ER-3]
MIRRASVALGFGDLGREERGNEGMRGNEREEGEGGAQGRRCAGSCTMSITRRTTRALLSPALVLLGTARPVPSRHTCMHVHVLYIYQCTVSTDHSTSTSYGPTRKKGGGGGGKGCWLFGSPKVKK